MGQRARLIKGKRPRTKGRRREKTPEKNAGRPPTCGGFKWEKQKWDREGGGTQNRLDLTLRCYTLYASNETTKSSLSPNSKKGNKQLTNP